GHGVPGIANIAGGAPGVAADFGPPFPNFRAAVLAKTVENRPAGFEQRVAHFLINGLHFFIGVEGAGAAPVVFEIVDAPGGESFGVLLFVAVAAFVAGAGVGTGRRVDADFQAVAVDVIGE